MERKRIWWWAAGAATLLLLAYVSWQFGVFARPHQAAPLVVPRAGPPPGGDGEPFGRGDAMPPGEGEPPAGGDPAVSEETEVPGAGQAAQRLNILLLGLDARVPGEPSRSHMMLLLSLDLIRREGALLSIPRDSRVLIPGRGLDKINHALFGHPAPLPALRELADRHGLLLIEDACEALGSTLHGVPCGSPRYAHGAVFAFYPNKQITTGEGGVVVTDDDRAAALCRSLRNQGRGEDGAWLTHVRLGYNYRMDEMSAAVGAVQMARLQELLDRRARVAAAYRRRLAEIPGVTLPEAAPGAQVQWFVWVVRLDPAIDRDRVMQFLLGRGIGCRPYFPPIHLQPFYVEVFGCRPGDLPVTEAVARTVLALPFHGGLSDAEIDEVAAALAEAVVCAAVRGGR